MCATSNRTNGVREGFGETSSPNGWSSYAMVSNFENLFTKTWTYPGDWTGSQLKHTWGSTTTKSNENPAGTTTPSETGSGTAQAIGSALEVPSWWSDTWLSAGWSELQTTWLARGLSWTWSNGGELLRIGFGVFEVVWGAGTSLTGIGVVPGTFVMANGIDNVLTGFFNLRYGKVAQGFSVFEHLIYSATGNETVALILPGLISGSVYTYSRSAANLANASSEGLGILAHAKPHDRVLVATIAYLRQRYPELPVVQAWSDLATTTSKFVYVVGHGNIHISGGTYSALIGATRYTPREISRELLRHLPDSVSTVSSTAQF